MRYIVLLCSLLLTLASPGHAAITWVADRTIAQTTGVDSASSAAFTPGAGNLLVVTVQMWANVGTPAMVVSDSVNGTYTLAVSRITSADPKGGLFQFYKNNVAASSTIVTVNPTPANAWFMTAISEYTGQEPSASVLDTVATMQGTQTSATSVGLTTAAPSGASNAVVAGLTWTIGPRTMTPGAGYTQIVELESGGSGGVNFVSIMRGITTAATPVTATWTTNATTDGNMIVGVYRASGGVVPTVVKAFPSAEGFGQNSVGGRGGKAYNINSLSTGSGSGGSCNAGGCGGTTPTFSPGTITLKDCMNDRFGVGRRTCIFRTGGTLDFSPGCQLCFATGTGYEQVVTPPYVTIAGQTAPGGGIMIRAHDIGFWNTHDIIVRHLRSRAGDVPPYQTDPGPPPKYTSSQGSVDILASHDVILDHMSMGWADDDTMWIERSPNTTVQWSIVSEGHGCPLCQAGGGTEISKVGGIDNRNLAVENTGGSFLHNYFSSHQWRAPLAAGGKVQFVNNVTYNMQIGTWVTGCTNNQPGALHSWIGEYYQNGPAGIVDVANRSPGLQLTGDGAPNTVPGCYGRMSYLYTSGNYHSGVCTSMAAGCQHSYIMASPTDTTLPANMTWLSTPPAFPVVASTTDAITGKNLALSQAGAYAVGGGIYATPRRDGPDARAVADLNTLSGTVLRSNFNSMADIPGGWPTYAAGTPYLDSDGDGMSDAWEDSHGLNKNDASDGPAYATNGYTNLENFMNELAGDTIPATPSTLPAPINLRLLTITP